MTVAALYVQKDGAYYGLDDVDPWDEERDARRYAGPWSVVAHPPCNKWSPLAYINQRRIPGYRVGDDGGCFAAALAAVEKWGGVLEHPASSVAWRTFGLPKPTRGYWLQTFAAKGWVTEVDQGSYGHRAKKTTWLYAVTDDPPDLDWTRAESDVIVSGFTHQPKGEHVACEHRRVRPKEASRTPDAFRDVLLAIAKGEQVSQVTRKGEKPASSPALDAELRRRSSAERRAARPSDAPQRVSTFPPHKPPKVHAGQLTIQREGAA